MDPVNVGKLMTPKTLIKYKNKPSYDLCRLKLKKECVVEI